MILRFLNKNTGEEKTIDIAENSTEYQIDERFAHDYCDLTEWVQIPDDGKIYEPCEESPFYQEKPTDINVLKSEKLIEVETGYTNAFLNGLNTSVGIKFHIKPEDQLNYIGAMIATQSLQDADVLPLPVIDFNGLTNSITVGASRQAYLEIVNYKAQTEVKRATFLGQIQAAQSHEELELIVINYAEPEA